MVYGLPQLMELLSFHGDGSIVTRRGLQTAVTMEINLFSLVHINYRPEIWYSHFLPTSFFLGLYIWSGRQLRKLTHCFHCVYAANVTSWFLSHSCNRFFFVLIHAIKRYRKTGIPNMLPLFGNEAHFKGFPGHVLWAPFIQGQTQTADILGIPAAFQ